MWGSGKCQKNKWKFANYQNIYVAFKGRVTGQKSSYLFKKSA